MKQKNTSATTKIILPAIVISQFFCTSLWFAGNSIISDMAKEIPGGSLLANMTSAIQFGFISGTLVFAVFMISDRFSPSRVFLASAILAGLFNLGMSIHGIHSTGLLLFRFATGFFLAGIYPVGMKIASDYYREGLGRSLGFLVGAVVMGTAFPHLLRNMITGFPWRYIVYATTALSMLGGLCILLLVPDGPYRKQGQEFRISSFLQGFRHSGFRAAAFGYFGHMWELYTFWAFVPIMLAAYNNHYETANLNVPLLSFTIIAAGAVGCACSGLLSEYFGVKRIATISLLLSGICCLISPLLLFFHSSILLVLFLFAWGIVVVADSPLFSTMVAQYAPTVARGTSLTIVTCIGFSLTIISIQFINMLSDKISNQYVYMLLAIGPLFGLIALVKRGQPGIKNKKPLTE